MSCRALPSFVLYSLTLSLRCVYSYFLKAVSRRRVARPCPLAPNTYVALIFLSCQIEWARKYGLRINMDLHALPGQSHPCLARRSLSSLISPSLTLSSLFFSSRNQEARTDGTTLVASAQST